MSGAQDREADQREFLFQAKESLGLEWDELAEASGITPRALKTYRLPAESSERRGMSRLARQAVQRLLDERAGKTRKKAA